MRGPVTISRGKTIFTEDRGHLQCPKMESLILRANVAEADKLRGWDGICAGGRVRGGAMMLS